MYRNNYTFEDHMHNMLHVLYCIYCSHYHQVEANQKRILKCQTKLENVIQFTLEEASVQVDFQVHMFKGTSCLTSDI